MPFNFSGWELLVILVIGLLLFGSRLPSVGKNLGKSIVEFKKGLKGVEEEVSKSTEEQSRAISEKSYRAPLGPGGEERRVAQSATTEVTPQSN